MAGFGSASTWIWCACVELEYRVLGPYSDVAGHHAKHSDTTGQYQSNTEVANRLWASAGYASRTANSVTTLNSSHSTLLATPCESLGLTSVQRVTGILLRYLDPMMGLTHPVTGWHYLVCSLCLLHLFVSSFISILYCLCVAFAYLLL